MTEEQKKAIDACKDQAAKEFESPLGNNPFSNWLDFLTNAPDYYGQVEQQHVQNDILTRAMQLYGEQCRKDSEKASAYTINRSDSIAVVISKTGKAPRLLLQALVLYKNIDFVSFEENEDAGTLAALFLPRDNDVAQRIVEYINTAN